MPEVDDSGQPLGVEVDDSGALLSGIEVDDSGEPVSFDNVVSGHSTVQGRRTGILPALARQLTGRETFTEAAQEMAQPQPKTLGEAAKKVGTDVLTAQFMPATMVAGEVASTIEKLKAASKAKTGHEQFANIVGAVPIVGRPIQSAGETLGRGDFAGGSVEAILALLNAGILGTGAKAGLRSIVARRAAKAATEAARIKALAGFKPVEAPLPIDVRAPGVELPSAVQAALKQADPPQVFAGETGEALRATGVPDPAVGPAAEPRIQPRVPAGDSIPEAGAPPTELVGLSDEGVPLDIQAGGVVPPAIEVSGGAPDVFTADSPQTLDFPHPTEYRLPASVKPTAPKTTPIDPSVSNVPLAPDNPPPPKPVLQAPSTGIGVANEGIQGSAIGGKANEIPLSRMQHVEEFKIPTDAEGSPSFGADLMGTIEKLTQSIKTARTASRATKAMQAKERGIRSARADKVRTEIGGEAGLAQAKTELAGELPKAEFEPFGKTFTKTERQQLFDAIQGHPDMQPFERIRAYDALSKVLDGGAVPQANELSLLGRVYGPDMAEALASKARIWSNSMLAKVWNLPRTLLSGPDLSYVFRQTKLMVSSPRNMRATFTPFIRPETGTRGNFWTMHNAFVQGLLKEPSKAFVAKAAEIAHRPNAPLYRLSNVDFTVKSELGGLASAEENFLRNNWATRIPALGRLYKASEEAALTYVNGMRADAYDIMARPYLRKGMTYETHPEIFNAIGEWVNITSGRGNLGAMEGNAAVLASGLFAPRLLKANLDIFNPLVYRRLYKADPHLAAQALTDVTAYIASRAAVVTLAYLGGAKINDDPRSAEFGKIRVGRARLDPWGGGMQVARAGMQLVTGEKTKLTGERIPVDKGDVFLEFLKQRRHPSLVASWNLLRQRGDRGEPIDWPKEMGRLIVALPAQDVYMLAREQPDALWMALPGSYGGSITSYDEPAELTEKDKKSMRAAEAAARVNLQLGRDLKGARPTPHQPSAQEREMQTQQMQRRRETELEIWGLIDNKQYARARSLAKRANQKYNYSFKVDKMIRQRRDQTPDEDTE